MLIRTEHLSSLIQWFLQDPGASDGGSSGTQETENHMLLKFRADFLYYRKQYSAAVEVYHRILEILPPTNGLVRKEVTDSLTRCQLHLGGYLEALEYAKSLVGWNVCWRLPQSHDHIPIPSQDDVQIKSRFDCLCPRSFLPMPVTRRHGNC